MQMPTCVCMNTPKREDPAACDAAVISFDAGYCAFASNTVSLTAFQAVGQGYARVRVIANMVRISSKCSARIKSTMSL